MQPERIPLSLYVHLPWCVAKCPYCDFNSHARRSELPERAYVDALLADLERDLAETGGRPLQTIFLGGGTPSLFSPEAIAVLLEGIARRAPVTPGAEITLEANPGTVDESRFAGFREAGVNRLSLGVQSFDDGLLKAIGRIHDAATAARAVESARRAGFDNLNLDLMFALPGQTQAQARSDLTRALSLQPEHISRYQLTLEPGTPFHHRPPSLPDADAAWDMQRQGGGLLRKAGYRQYEVSAWARPGRRCRHNLNYWRFGDYLGIGAGAHGKLTLPGGRLVRTAKVRQPGYYLARAGGDARLAERREVTGGERAFEFMLNALRLNEGAPVGLFRRRTGLGGRSIARRVDRARRRGLLRADLERFQPTALGRRFLDDLVAEFL